MATLGIPSAVFISSNEDNTHGPWPVHDGLPTVEDHRWIPAELQVRHWIAVGDVDEIIFGNAFASEEEFKASLDPREILKRRRTEGSANPEEVSRMLAELTSEMAILKEQTTMLAAASDQSMADLDSQFEPFLQEVETK